MTDFRFWSLSYIWEVLNVNKISLIYSLEKRFLFPCILKKFTLYLEIPPISQKTLSLHYKSQPVNKPLGSKGDFP
jgi:hypothetical protein